MTANELADKLVESNSVSWGDCTHEQHDNDKYFKEQASAMLRQQTKEIEALRLRELTDAEILEVCSQIEPFDDITIEQAFIEFARAILQKASEK
jgi:hypothetical protein